MFNYYDSLQVDEQAEATEPGSRRSVPRRYTARTLFHLSPPSDLGSPLRAINTHNHSHSGHSHLAAAIAAVQLKQQQTFDSKSFREVLGLCSTPLGGIAIASLRRGPGPMHMHLERGASFQKRRPSAILSGMPNLTTISELPQSPRPVLTRMASLVDMPSGKDMILKITSKVSRQSSRQSLVSPSLHLRPRVTAPLTCPLLPSSLPLPLPLLFLSSPSPLPLPLPLLVLSAPHHAQVKVVAANEVQHVMDEARILASEAANHPFIAKLQGKFQTPDALVLVFAPILCGDLWSLLYDKVPVPFTALGQPNHTTRPSTPPHSLHPPHL
jgi:hypothetical protein